MKSYLLFTATKQDNVTIGIGSVIKNCCMQKTWSLLGRRFAGGFLVVMLMLGFHMVTLAQTFVKTVDGVTITVSAEAGVLPVGTRLDARILSEIEKEEYLEALQNSQDYPPPLEGL